MKTATTKHSLIVGAALALVTSFVALGTDSTASATSAMTVERAVGRSAPGCQNGVTNPSDLSPNRKVARCTPGNPKPKPLKQMTTVTMSSAFKLEFNSPVLLADSLGEFKKENIDFKLVNLPFSDAVPQLASGQLDAAIGGLEIALFNAGHNSLPVKAVMGNYYPPDAGNPRVPQTGLWCRRDAFTNPQKPNLKQAEKLRWASAVGKGSVAMYYASTEIKTKVPSFDVSKVTVQQVPSADTVTALQNKAVDCGILLDPVWLQVANDPNYFLAATQTPGEPLGMIAYGKSLLQDHPEVGVAFARAIIRTINTYFQGDYHKDPKVLAEIAKDINQPTANLTRTPSLVMDWELRKGTTTRVQKLFIQLGVITDYQQPVAENKVVDRSFYLKAVGANG